MASRSAVMISGERSANCASSFLRRAGASWAAAALRWMTRPARSSSTAGSGMPATTAATAAASTGLAPRTSSRDVAAGCSRQGTSAAAVMQPNTTKARSGDNSSNATSTASASPATSSTMAEPRKRSGQGAKKEAEVGGASIAIWAASPYVSAASISGEYTCGPGACPDPLDAAVATLSHINSVGLGRSLQPGLQSTCGGLAQALRPGPEDKLAKRQQDYRYDERRNIIKQAEQQHARQELLAVHLPEADQHGGIEHPEAPRRMAGKAQQRRRDEYDRDHDEAEIGLVGHQHVHRQRAEGEIDNPDHDLQQRQRPARQRHAPGPAADHARHPGNPDHVADQRAYDDQREPTIQPGRQLIDRGRGFRMKGDPQSQHRGIAKPEGEAGEKADLRHIDRVQPPRRIDAVAHRAAGEDAGPDIVAD